MRCISIEERDPDIHRMSTKEPVRVVHYMVERHSCSNRTSRPRVEEEGEEICRRIGVVVVVVVLVPWW